MATANGYFIRGNVLQLALKKNNLSQTDLAQMVNFDSSELSKAIHNKRRLPIPVVKSICNLLDIDEKDFINEDMTNSIRRSMRTNSSSGKIGWNTAYFKETLAKRRITLKQFSADIGRHPSSFNGYTLGKSNPSPETVRLVCDKLKCSYKRLIGLTEEEFNELYPIDNNVKKDVNAVREPNNVVSDGPDDSDILDIPEYKHFPDQNVVNNLNIINENIIILAENLAKSNEQLFKELQEVKSVNEELVNRLNSIEGRLEYTRIDDNGNKTTLTANNVSETKTTVLWGNNSCSEKEMQEIIKSDANEGDKELYKKKVYKLISYISKKQNLIFNQILHNNYSQFTKVYGFDLTKLKADTENKGTLDAIYDTPMCREIFFNMICTNASNI